MKQFIKQIKEEEKKDSVILVNVSWHVKIKYKKY